MEQRSILPDTLVTRTDVQSQGSWDEAIPQAFRKSVNWIENKSILTPTSGFLDSGFTHTLNSYVGCSNAGSLCGLFCYAQHFITITKGRPWGLYGAKRNIKEAYQRDYDRLKHPRKGDPKSLRVYMSSVTDPYLPQEKQLCLTQTILEAMQARPPDVLVIQTHTILINRDFDLIRQLAGKCELWVSITCETDMDSVPGFPPHPSRPAKRIETLKRFRNAGVQTQATISPLMPLADPEQFAKALHTACDRVIIDHYEFGDGTHGARTRRTNFPQLLETPWWLPMPVKISSASMPRREEPALQPPPIQIGTAALQASFNAGISVPRLVFLVSPTCDICVSGAQSAVQAVLSVVDHKQ